MIAPYDKCHIKFSINGTAGECGADWIDDILKHTLVDEIICIEDVVIAEGGGSKDATKSIIDFCMRNPNAIIVLMCGEFRKTQYDENRNVIKVHRNQQLREYENLAKMKALYEIIGFQDISAWIDYAGTGVFLYKNSQSIDFIDRLSAWQAGAYLSAITSTSSVLDIIKNELSDAPNARIILENILRECGAPSAVEKMNAFGTKPNA